MRYESVASECAFVLGPVAVGVIASALRAGTPLIITAGITALFVTTFAHHNTRKIPTFDRHAGATTTQSSLHNFRLLILPAGMFFVGAIFGSTLTA
jgi:hypothetical protein